MPYFDLYSKNSYFAFVIPGLCSFCCQYSIISADNSILGSGSIGPGSDAGTYSSSVTSELMSPSRAKLGNGKKYFVKTQDLEIYQGRSNNTLKSTELA